MNDLAFEPDDTKVASEESEAERTARLELYSKEKAFWNLSAEEVIKMHGEVNARLKVFCSKDSATRNSDLVLISDLLSALTFKEFQDSVIALSSTSEDIQFPIEKYSRECMIKDFFTSTFGPKASKEEVNALRNITFLEFKLRIAEILESDPQSKLGNRQLEIIFNRTYNRRHEYLTAKKKMQEPLSEMEESEISIYFQNFKRKTRSSLS